AQDLRPLERSCDRSVLHLEHPLLGRRLAPSIVRRPPRMCIRPLPYLPVEGPTCLRAGIRTERLWCVLASTRRTPVPRKKQTPHDPGGGRRRPARVWAEEVSRSC